MAGKRATAAWLAETEEAAGNGMLDAALDDAHEDAAVSARPRATKSKRVGLRTRQVREFEVVLWVTNLHDIEIGIYQHSRNQAKSRQFTKDMDVFGEIKSDGSRSGLLGFRRELWKSQTGMDKRLVIKLFSASLNWRGTLDMMIGRSLQLTHGARGLPVTAFSLNLNDHDQVVHLERSANKWTGLPENFSFFLLEDGRPRFYRLRSDMIAIGDDYTLFDERDKKVGHLDGRVLNLGGKWVVTLDAQHATPKLEMVLQLFCGMLRFNDQCLDHVEDLVKGVRAGKFVPGLESTEADLYMNPRRVR
jgi:hypothetical protein